MIVKFQQYIDQHQLCNNNDQILVAVSGGIDSIAMLHLFVKSNYKIAIAHCNFQLRARESDEDEKFVQNLGRHYGIDVFTKRFDTKSYAENQKISIQMAARELRYEWFEQLMEENGFNILAMAQHADDQVETFFINLLRGSGLTGLRGMPLKRDRIIRPLLFARREEIITYVKKNSLFYREDSSNNEDTYLRNKIRLQLLPDLLKIDRNVIDAILESIGHLNESDRLLQFEINERYKIIFKENDGYLRVSKNDIEKLQPREIWMYYLLRKFNFNRDTTNKITNAICGTQTGKIFFSVTHEAVIDRNDVLIRPLKKVTDETYFINDDQDSITEPLNLRFENVPNNQAFKINTDAQVAQVDKDKLNFPLILRKWQHGDRFRPIGLKGSKLLSDYFIDKKFSRFEKEEIWLLLSQNEIVWVIGYQIADAFKISEKTKNILCIERF